MDLPVDEKAFVAASIDIKVEEEKEEAKKLTKMQREVEEDNLWCKNFTNIV